jgi:hypothetical protein
MEKTTKVKEGDKCGDGANWSMLRGINQRVEEGNEGVDGIYRQE